MHAVFRIIIGLQLMTSEAAKGAVHVCTGDDAMLQLVSVQ